MQSNASTAILIQMAVKSLMTRKNNDIPSTDMLRTFMTLCKESISNVNKERIVVIPKKMPRLDHVPSTVDVIVVNIPKERKCAPNTSRMMMKRAVRTDEPTTAR